MQNHLAKLNDERGHVADDLLQNFTESCRIVNESIRGEISGSKGEYKALRSIETVRAKHTVLRNIELSAGDHRTELDIIVFTEKAIFVVEAKNPTRDIVIVDRGNYCRINNGHTSFDKNIGEKMNDKTYLLRGVLQDAGVENPNIISLVVFTNNNISVTNNFPFIQHCFLSSLPHLIDNYQGADLYAEEAIDHMVSSVESAKSADSYELPLDVNQFKQDFADLMVKLENTPEEEPEEIVEPVKAEVVAVNAVPIWLKRVGSALAVIPVAGLVAVAAIGFGKLARR